MSKRGPRLPVLEFQEDGHVYTLDGARLSSNTQILKAEKFIDNDFYTDEGREKGIRIHEACWYLDDGDLVWDSVPIAERGNVRAYSNFKRDVNFVPELVEVAVWSEHGYATRLDRVGLGDFTINGVTDRYRALIDLKGGGVEDWVALQLAGQEIALNERIQKNDLHTPDGHFDLLKRLPYNHNHPYPELRFSLQLRKDGTYRLKHWQNPNDRNTYLSAVNNFHWKAGRR